MPKKKEPPKPTRRQLLDNCIGILTGLDHQLGCATHFEEATARVKIVLDTVDGISAEHRKELENLTLWLDRSRKAAGQFREKLEAMTNEVWAAR